MLKNAFVIFLLSTCLGITCVHAQMLPESPHIEPEEMRSSRIVPPKMLAVSETQQELNKRIVLQFHYEFFNLARFDEAIERYLRPDFIQHDPAEPSGAKNYANYFKTSGYKPRSMADRPKIKWVLADGDLVVLAFDKTDPWPGGPQPTYTHPSLDIFRVVDGKIAEMWYSGWPPNIVPAQAPSSDEKK